MVKTNMIKAQMALYGFTITKLASSIGISTKTLSTKLNKEPNKFTQEEMQNIVSILKIEDPGNIFFASK